MGRKGKKPAASDGGFIKFDPTSSGRKAAREPADEGTRDAPAAAHTNRFEFIDNSSASSTRNNSTQVRRHVMQEFMRKKRWEDRKRQEGVDEDQALLETPPYVHSQQPSAARPLHEHAFWQSQASSPPGQALSARGIADPLQSLNGPPSMTRRPRRPFVLGPASFAALADLLPRHHLASARESRDSSSFRQQIDSASMNVKILAAIQPSPHPGSVMSASRTDPFRCLPLDLNKQDEELFDFLVHDMPARIRGRRRYGSQVDSWVRRVLVPEAMNSAISFQSIVLAHAARAQAMAKGVQDTRASIEHHTLASRMLLEQFHKHPNDSSDASLSATLSVAALEDRDPRLERRVYTWMHFRAAMRKIRDRGGPPALAATPRLQRLINWIDYMLSGYSSSGPTFYFHHNLEPASFRTANPNDIAVQELQEQCDEFITFLHCSEKLAVVHAELQRTPVSLKRQPLRFSIFQSTKPLHRILSMASERHARDGSVHETIARLAALLTINTAIWEYRHAPEVFEGFLRQVTVEMGHDQQQDALSAEGLIQILLIGSEQRALLDTERCWFVGRMLKVAKRLDSDAFRRLNAILLSHLTLGPGFRASMDDWEEELRCKVLQAPLICHVMPFCEPY